MEEAIKNYLKHSFLSLIPRRHRARLRPQRRSIPVASITRIQAGLPHGQSVAAHALARPPRSRRTAPPTTYTRGTYLARSRYGAHARQQIFRIA